MSLRRSRYYTAPTPKMPLGLVELMDGLARDVLKNNPDNIYDFCTNHMYKLLEMRDGHAPKQAMKLDKKIAKAQEVVKKRAQQRRNKYDQSLHSTSIGHVEKESILIVSDTQQCDEKGNTIISNETDNNIEEKKEDILNNYPIETIIDHIENGAKIRHDENNQIPKLNLTLASVEIQDDEEKFKDNSYSDKQDEDLNDHNQEKEIKLEIHASTNTLEGNLTKMLNDNMPVSNNMDEESLHVLKDSDINELKEQVKHSETSKAIINLEKDDNSPSEYIDNRNPEKSEMHNDAQGDICENDSMVNKEEISTTNISISDQIHSDNNGVTLEEQDGRSVGLPHRLNDDDKVTLDYLMKKSSDGDKEKNEVQDTPVKINKEQSEQNALLKVESEISEVSGTESVTDSGEDKIQNNINTSMDLETAAVTIQKVFRSFLFRAKTASFDDATTVDINLLSDDKEKVINEGSNVLIKDRRSLGISRMDTVLQTVNEEKSLSLSTDDSSTLSSAATIIQAHVRGFLVRNKLNLNKTISSNSLIDSDVPSGHSLDVNSDNLKNKTVLNIHIVPETSHFVSREESVLTSMDLSLDGSPPSSVNLHPLGYNTSERRKQLKREDAIQSVSPPSNNSGKLSDDVDSIKEILISDSDSGLELQTAENRNATKTLIDSYDEVILSGESKIQTKVNDSNNEIPIGDAASDEMDVITPYTPVEDSISTDLDNSSKLLHSGEFHDVVVPTKVSRSDTSVVREFQNVLVYFILWNN